MKERPILMSTEMVKAILDGRKTMTRRVVGKPIGKGYVMELDKAVSFVPSVAPDCWISQFPVDLRAIRPNSKPTTMNGNSYRCPYGQVGSYLWVKEALKKKPDYSWCKEGYAVYTADNEQVLIGGSGIGEGVPWQWKRDLLTGMFMPRWASRITLEITNIRVERLQEITPSGCAREGSYLALGKDDEGGFINLWDSINAKRGYSWESNPWVWVIEFRQIKELKQ